MPYEDYDPDDPDAPQPMDLEDSEDEAETCPACGRPVHELAAICPHCGEWMGADSQAARRSRGWFWPLMIGLLVALILVMWAGLR